MKTSLDFLTAAKRAYIGELEHLARTGTLVKVTGNLIHEIQRERGISNIYLGSQGTRFADERIAQGAVCGRVENKMRQSFDQWQINLDLNPGHGARLFHCIAYVLHGLDALPQLRELIGAQHITAAQASSGFNKLIAGMLSVMFEAADSATDTEISRHLVAMFHFTQGKEFAGQERALGSALFASGQSDQLHQQQWSHLVDTQERCFKVFMEFSSEPALKVLQRCITPSVQSRFDELRDAVQHAAYELDSERSAEWYQLTTQRIDSMHTVEETLAADLVKLCRQKTAAARTELSQLERAPRQQQPFFASMELLVPAPPSGSPPAATTLGPQLEHSILGLVQEQAQRLQTMSDELAAVRATLSERKLVERAKGLLMSQQQISEDEAYRLMRQMAMSQNRRLIDVAQSLITLTDQVPIKATPKRSSTST